MNKINYLKVKIFIVRNLISIYFINMLLNVFKNYIYAINEIKKDFEYISIELKKLKKENII